MAATQQDNNYAKWMVGFLPIISPVKRTPTPKEMLDPHLTIYKIGDQTRHLIVLPKRISEPWDRGHQFTASVNPLKEMVRFDVVRPGMPTYMDTIALFRHGGVSSRLCFFAPFLTHLLDSDQGKMTLGVVSHNENHFTVQFPSHGFRVSDEMQGLWERASISGREDQ